MSTELLDPPARPMPPEKMIGIVRTAVVSTLELFPLGTGIANLVISPEMLGQARDWYLRVMGWIQTSANPPGYRCAAGAAVVDVPPGEALRVEQRSAFRSALLEVDATDNPDDVGFNPL